MRATRWFALVLVLALVAAACGDSGGDGGADLEGTSVSVFGPESSDEEAGAMQDALNVFAERNGMTITYTGARDFSDQINAQVVGGNPPDIAIFPQPGKVSDFAREGFVEAVPADVADASADEWPQAWIDFGTTDGTVYAVPNKSDLKSLVWYVPSRFEADGYDVPETWDDLKALTSQIIADGGTPWCVGIESGPATGWTFTDWNEDLLLRFEDVSFYDDWVNHDVPFNSPEIESIWNEILDLWNTPGAVYAAGGTIAATPFGDSGGPLVDGTCYMHRQASFYSAFIPEGTAFGNDEGAVNVFYFPSTTADDKPALVAGTLAASFRDAPEVWGVMEFLTSSEYGNERVAAQITRKGGGEALSGYLSANSGVDLDNWPVLEQSMIEILQNAAVARFDASDLMPAAVGAGTFWTEATSAVNGDKSVKEALDAIEASWP